MRKIGLDVDGVLCNFPEGLIAMAAECGLADRFPASWKDVDHYFIASGGDAAAFNQVFAGIKHSTEFWLKLKPLPYCAPLDFVPDCYITSRPVDTWITEQWLWLWRFPRAPVFTVRDHKDKLIHILDRKLDLFVDDYYPTVEYLLENGANAVLYAAPYQRGHAVDHLPTISHLSQVKSYDPEELPTNGR